MHEPFFGRSFFCDFLSEYPSGWPGPLCVWWRTGRCPYPGPPTRYCHSCHHFLASPGGTGTGGFSSCCLERKNMRLIKTILCIWPFFSGCSLTFCRLCWDPMSEETLQRKYSLMSFLKEEWLWSSNSSSPSDTSSGGLISLCSSSE